MLYITKIIVTTCQNFRGGGGIPGSRPPPPCMNPCMYYSTINYSVPQGVCYAIIVFIVIHCLVKECLIGY